jgi:hypothetical protein
MIEVLNYEIKPTPMRLGWINVRYHDILIRCSICVFKDEKLFVRMPEMFLKERKMQFVSWISRKHSNAFQNQMLEYLKEKEGLDLAKAVILKAQGQEKKKKDDNNKKSI